MQNTLINYIRKNNKQPHGVVVAVRNNNEVFYGYSLCNKVDKWDRKEGIDEAVKKALSGGYDLPVVKKTCKKVLNALEHMERRALKYFKDLPKEKIAFEMESND